MTDGYDDNGTVLLVTAGDDLPEEVRFSCDGINSPREYSPAARLPQEVPARVGSPSSATAITA